MGCTRVLAPAFRAFVERSRRTISAKLAVLSTWQVSWIDRTATLLNDEGALERASFFDVIVVWINKSSACLATDVSQVGKEISLRTEFA